MKTYKHNGADVAEFASLDDFVNSVRDSRGTDGHENADGARTWWGSETWEEGIALALNGWSDVRKDVDAILDRIADKVRHVSLTVFDMSRDVAGLMVDMGAFMTGEPACMLSPVPTESRQSGKVVRIHYNTGAMAHVSADSMIRRGVAVIALIDALNGVGVNCEVWTESAAQNGSRSGTVLTCLKQAHETVDVNRLMFVLANPSFHRRLTFAARKVFKIAGIKRGGDCSSRSLMMADYVGADVHVVSAHSDRDPIAKDPDSWILGELARLGFTVND